MVLVPGLYPLWVVILFIASTLGWTPEQAKMGLTDEQIYGHHIYLAEEWLKPSLDYIGGYEDIAGYACDESFRTNDYMIRQQDYFCGQFRHRVSMVYQVAWSDPIHFTYMVRHEVEHQILGPYGPPDDPFNEKAATAAGCAAIWDPGYCK